MTLLMRAQVSCPRNVSMGDLVPHLTCFVMVWVEREMDPHQHLRQIGEPFLRS